MTLQKDFSLKRHNTFGMDVKARFFCEVNDVHHLKQLLSTYKHLPLLILGGGSNLLLTKDFEGLVVKINLTGKEIHNSNEKECIVRVGAGENWHELVLWSLEQNCYGLENLSLIPGNAGTAPMQNIGAYGVEIKDVFHSLEAIEIATGETKHFAKEECHFGYRESIFKNELKGKYIISSVQFKLSLIPNLKTSYGAIQKELEAMGIKNPNPKDVSNAVINIRKSKLPDPKEIGNSGSFFKNPVIPVKQYESLLVKFPDLVSYPVSNTHVKLAAGWLIEKAGWKGKTFNNYGVHKKQALVLVNYDDAKGADIAALAKKIQQSILNTFDVELHTEVNII